MRVLGVALLSGVVLLGACGGGESQKAATDSTATATPAATPAPTGGMTMAPITGTVHEVRMVGDATGYRFEPATITAKPGDGIKFITVSGFPHNVAFDPAVWYPSRIPQVVPLTSGLVDSPVSTKTARNRVRGLDGSAGSTRLPGMSPVIRACPTMWKPPCAP